MNPLLYILLGVMMIVVSCKVSHDQTTTSELQTSDSTYSHTTVRVDTLRIPTDTAVVRIPVQVIQRDTVIEVRNRWARARVVVRDSIVTLTANCDSLERLVLSYRSELVKVRNRQQNREHTSVKETNRILPWYGWAIGIAVLLIIIILKILLK